MRKHRPLLDRFWSKVDIKGDNDCWEWQAGRNKKGYGHFKLGVGSDIRAHRLSWMLTCGEIPDGLNVLHKCDNPPCCNPNHLFIGTAKDNILDALSKGRIDTRPGVRNPNSILTEKDVLEIRSECENYEYGIYSRLGRKYGVKSSVIRGVAIRISWTHI